MNWQFSREFLVSRPPLPTPPPHPSPHPKQPTLCEGMQISNAYRAVRVSVLNCRGVLYKTRPPLPRLLCPRLAELGTFGIFEFFQ